MFTIAAANSQEAVRLLAEDLREMEIPIEVYCHKREEGDIYEIQVSEGEEERVLEYLKSDGSPREGIVRCPGCGDVNVEYPGRPRYSGSAAMAERLVESLHIKKPKFYCRSCHNTWD